MISAGQLHWSATRLIASASRDALGMRTDSWTNGITFPVSMRQVTAAETQYADGVAVRRNCEVRARWPALVAAGVTEVDRLLVDGLTLRITSIIDLDEAGRVGVIQCEQVS